MAVKKKKILVTGSGGFIFGNFIRRAFHLRKPYNIVSLDRVRESHLMHNMYVNKDHSFYIADIRDPHMLNVIFQTERPDIVVHGAAESFVDSSIKDPSPFITSNVVGTQNIIDICLETDVERLVYISTDEVYGQLTSEEDEAWTESSNINPRNTYSASKAAGELLVRAAHETHGLQYQITRCCNNYGPWQDPEKFIPKIIQHVFNGKSVPIYGKGDQVRDWIHVWDKCEALFKIIDEGEENTVYNISAGQEFSNVETFQLVCNALGKGHDLLKFVEDRPGHDFRYSVDSSKLRELGWKPNLKFKEGLEQTCKWYELNKFFLEQHED